MEITLKPIVCFMLKKRNVFQKLDVLQHSLDTRQFRENQAVLGMCMNSCVWASVHLSKDGDQFQGVLRNMDVGSIQNVFTTVRHEVLNLQEGELIGLQD